MMKKLFLFAALAVASWLGAVDTALLKYLPAKSAGMGVIEVAKLSRHSEIRAALEDPESVGAFESLGIMPQDVRDIAGFYVDDDSKGLIVRIADGKALKAKLDASPMIKAGDTEVQIAAMELNGVRVYRCNVQGKNEAVFASFVADDVLAFSDSETELEAYLKAPKFDGSQSYPNAAKVAVWGIWNNPDVKPESKDGQLLSVEATLDVVGKEQQDVVVAAVLNCDRDEYAAQMGMVIPGFVSMGCGAIFGDNPELGQKLLDMFKTKVNGKSLRLSLRITPEIAKYLSEFIAKTAKESSAAEDKSADKKDGEGAAAVDKAAGKKAGEGAAAEGKPVKRPQGGITAAE